MAKQTSIEWLEHKLNSVKPTDFCSIETIKEWLIEAKQMHKEEHRKTWIQSVMSKYKTFEQYYNETYVNNHIVDTNEMIDHIGDANKMVEISDEDIEDVAWEKFITDSGRFGFISGAKWYREQLKKK
jgi:hypothetical protein